jgi:predicted Zn-dependent peptidase
MILAAGGNVDFDALLRQAESYCGGWHAFDAPRETAPPQPRRDFQVIHKAQAVQEYVVQLAAGPSTADNDRYAARVLATIVGDDSGSRLFWELVDTGQAESASIGTQEYQGAGVFLTWLSCLPDLTEDNLRRIAEVVAEVEADGVTEEELAQAKNKLCAHIVLQAERPTNRMFAVGNAWIQRRQYKTVRENVEMYRAVTLDDIARVLKKYPLSRTATVAVGPLTSLATPNA